LFDVDACALITLLPRRYARITLRRDACRLLRRQRCCYVMLYAMFICLISPLDAYAAMLLRFTISIHMIHLRHTPIYALICYTRALIYALLAGAALPPRCYAVIDAAI